MFHKPLTTYKMMYTRDDLESKKGDDLRAICKKLGISIPQDQRTNDKMINLIYKSKENMVSDGNESDDERPTRSARPQASGMSALDKAFEKLDSNAKLTAFVKELPNYKKTEDGVSKSAALKDAKKEGHTRIVEEFALEMCSKREIIQAINKATTTTATPANSRTSLSVKSSKKAVGHEVTSRRR